MTESTCYAASLSTDEFAMDSNIAIYPNPAKETVYIKNKSNTNIDKITIYNVLGKQVFQTILKTINKQNVIDVSNYVKGIYLIKLESEFGSTTKKLLVN